MLLISVSCFVFEHESHILVHVLLRGNWSDGYFKHDLGVWKRLLHNKDLFLGNFPTLDELGKIYLQFAKEFFLYGARLISGTCSVRLTPYCKVSKLSLVFVGLGVSVEGREFLEHVIDLSDWFLWLYSYPTACF